ncbi:PepSY domain-containing protein [Sporosarcina sp. FSL W7-1349]|uniref:PepSY domain-containing protein n=1 Tax=Sporosarcina sp. FSL W7-1349 TaxID=2921561 RepID=UPI0030F5AD33
MTNRHWQGNDGYWGNHWQNPQYRRISLEQAISIAQEQVPGNVVKAELDYDDGRLIYEIDIRTAQGLKYEVKVDANTGQVIRVKLD